MNYLKFMLAIISSTLFAGASTMALADSSQKLIDQAKASFLLQCKSHVNSNDKFDIRGNQLGNPCGISLDLLNNLPWSYRGYAQLSYNPSRNSEGSLLELMNKVNLSMKDSILVPNADENFKENPEYIGDFNSRTRNPFKEYEIHVQYDKYGNAPEDFVNVNQISYQFCQIDETNTLKNSNSFMQSLIDKYGTPTIKLTGVQLWKKLNSKNSDSLKGLGWPGFYEIGMQNKKSKDVVLIGWSNKSEVIAIAESTNDFECGASHYFRSTLWNIDAAHMYSQRVIANKNKYFKEQKFKAAAPQL